MAAGDVTVTNPDGQADTLPNGMTVRVPAPTVDRVEPPIVAPGAQTVRVIGKHFRPGCTVTFADAETVSVQFVSQTELAVAILVITGPTAPPEPSGERQLLDAETDFTLLGSFDLQDTDPYISLFYGEGLTHRYVGGQLRFITMGSDSGNTIGAEYPAPALGAVGTKIRSWADIIAPGWGGQQIHRSVWWDADHGHLVTTVAHDYPIDPITIDENRSISIEQLNDDGTVTNLRRFIRYETLGQRWVLGGVRKVPAWYATAQSVGPYCIGFGGYTSLMAQGRIPSLGHCLATIPDPFGYASDAVIPAANTIILSDHRSGNDSVGSNNDWYDDDPAVPTTLDRGRRQDITVVNYFEDPNAPPNTGGGSGPPADPPSPQAQWLSPSPDGFGRFIWGDGYYNAACWIDNDAGTRSKHGFVSVATLALGKAWYGGSAGHQEGTGGELHVFDPAHFAEVKATTRAPWAVQPSSYKNLTDDFNDGKQMMPGYSIVTGCDFDATTNRLYVSVHGLFETGGVTPAPMRVWVYQVAGA